MTMTHLLCQGSFVNTARFLEPLGQSVAPGSVWRPSNPSG